MQVDAIVNAANTELQMGGGVCGAIFSAAGTEKLKAACKQLAPIQFGEAVVTPAFDLPAKYVIHAAGPVYHDGQQGEESLLRSCYTNALDLALKYGCESVAFPLISSGIFGYPKDEALAVATNAIGKWLMKYDMDVSLVVFDKAAFALSQKLLSEVEAFIDENYVDMHVFHRRNLLSVEEKALAAKRLRSYRAPSGDSLGDRLERLDEPFAATLFRLIDAKGKNDSEVYKRANIDRRLFSKIRSDKDYRPKKETIVALAVALELTLSETGDLLERAGLALSRSMMFDVIVEYFITRGKYDIFEINNVLYDYDQPILGGKTRD
jgi:O-acetyl-ADP-ribose deacetylase (regulator of RNase III)